MCRIPINQNHVTTKTSFASDLCCINKILIKVVPGVPVLSKQHLDQQNHKGPRYQQLCCTGQSGLLASSPTSIQICKVLRHKRYHHPIIVYRISTRTTTFKLIIRKGLTSKLWTKHHKTTETFTLSTLGRWTSLT